MISKDVLTYYERGVELKRLETPSGRLEYLRTSSFSNGFSSRVARSSTWGAGQACPQ
ncbi:MAG TPA: hypothetical protein VFN99_06460 [Gaiella sp.]|nr:hypothetical protein [Gaiella sp.]